MVGSGALSFGATGGTLNVSGANTYTGGTTVSAGTLNYSATTAPTGGGSLGNFTVSGGTLAVSGTGFTSSTNTIALSGGTLSLGSGSFTFGTMAVTANSILDFGTSGVTTLNLSTLNITSGVTLTVLNYVASSDVFTAASVTNTGGGNPKTVTGLVFGGYSPTTANWDSAGQKATFAIIPAGVAVPEPSTYGAMLMGGCAGLMGWRRWRSRRESALKA